MIFYLQSGCETQMTKWCFASDSGLLCTSRVVVASPSTWRNPEKEWRPNEDDGKEGGRSAGKIILAGEGQSPSIYIIMYRHWNSYVKVCENALRSRSFQKPEEMHFARCFRYQPLTTVKFGPFLCTLMGIVCIVRLFFLKNICVIQLIFVPLHPNFEERRLVLTF